MISIFFAAAAPKSQRALNLLGTSVQDGLRFFLLFGTNFYFTHKLSFLINTLFGNVLKLQECRINKATACATLMLKKIFSAKYIF